MSDIAGPPAPKEIQSQIRGADKTAHVAKDPNNTNTPTGGQPREQTARDHGEAQNSRDPAVSIASSAAHLVSGQEIVESVAKIDSEGRPIIVTDSVTLALKPDAGLKPDDIVQLKIIDAGKQVTADLIRQNSLRIDPPVRLSVTVIEIHASEKLLEAAMQQTPPKLDTPYQNPIGALKKQPAIPISTTEQTTNITALIGGKTSLHSDPVEIKQSTAQASGFDGNKSGMIRPSPAITSAADLATLIQQQSASTHEKPVGSQLSAELQQSVKTATNIERPFAATGTGIGPALTGVSLSGAPAVIQLLDTAISTVAPAEVASVKNVQTITAAEARALPMGASILGASTGDGGLNAGELVKLETTRGEFILRATDATGLGGELVRVSVGAIPDAQPNNASAQNTGVTLRALLIENTPGAVPAKIDISFVGADSKMQEPAGNVATITSVQTVAAFFGAEGPKTDLRLQTTAGDISITVPSGVKPQIGDQLTIIRSSDSGTSATGQPIAPPVSTMIASNQTGLATEMNGGIEATIGQSTHAATAAATPNILTGWPAMEESLAALLGTNAGAAASLVARTAQGGRTLANSLMFFLKAAGMNVGADWIGDDIEKALSRSSQRALGNLRADLTQMAVMTGETVGEWRPILLPFDARGGDVALAALLLGQRADVDPDGHKGGSAPEQGNEEKSQRFILQVQFSVLGDIQLDGNISKRTFDLTVRSKINLPQGLQQDAAKLFYASLSANDFSGGIDFLRQSDFTIDAAALIATHLQGKKAE